MSDEKKVNAETTEVQEPTSSTPAPKKKRWPIVLSALAVVVIAVLIAFLHWHEEPSFCSTFCHTPMTTYTEGYYSEDPSLSVANHAAAGVTCLGCHWSQAKMLDLVHEVVIYATDSFTDPLPDQSQFVNDEFCGACHDGVTAPTKESVTEGWAYDPHNIPEVAAHEGQDFACGSCHRIHKQSVLTCAECHTGFIGSVEDEQMQAALSNWAIPAAAETVSVPSTAEAYGIYDPHAGDTYVQFSTMHETAGSDGGVITCADCHETKTIVCAECHEGVYDENLPEGWTLGVNEAKAATAELYGVYDPHAGDTYVQFSPMHETAGSDGGVITCADCHDTKVIKCAMCHLNTFESNLPAGWSVPEGAMDVSALAAAEEPAADEAAADEGAAASAADVADGEYTASGKGLGGEVPVTVTVADGKITAVTVGDNSETQGIGTKAIDQLPSLIVEANGTDGVDAVSGATVTSKAIFSAVNDALAQGAAA